MDEPSRHRKQALPSRLAVEVVPSSLEGAAPAPAWWCWESRRWRKEEPSAKTLGREMLSLLVVEAATTPSCLHLALLYLT
jgi:hypothetical protein